MHTHLDTWIKAFFHGNVEVEVVIAALVRQDASWIALENIESNILLSISWRTMTLRICSMSFPKDLFHAVPPLPILRWVRRLKLHFISTLSWCCTPIWISYSHQLSTHFFLPKSDPRCRRDPERWFHKLVAILQKMLARVSQFGTLV